MGGQGPRRTWNADWIRYSTGGVSSETAFELSEDSGQSSPGGGRLRNPSFSAASSAMTPRRRCFRPDEPRPLADEAGAGR